MIENQLQLQITREQLQRLRHSLQHLEAEHSRLNHIDPDPIVYKAQGDSLKSVIEEFEQEIAEYERKTTSK